MLDTNGDMSSFLYAVLRMAFVSSEYSSMKMKSKKVAALIGSSKEMRDVPSRSRINLADSEERAKSP